MNSNKNNIDKEIYDTYYSKKNKEVLPIIIFFSFVFLIFRGSIIFEAILWGCYALYCNNNNQNLRNNQENIKQREHLMKVKDYMENGGR